jgi:hypothetical protein
MKTKGRLGLRDGDKKTMPVGMAQQFRAWKAGHYAWQQTAAL